MYSELRHILPNKDAMDKFLHSILNKESGVNGQKEKYLFFIYRNTNDDHVPVILMVNLAVDLNTRDRVLAKDSF